MGITMEKRLLDLVLLLHSLLRTACSAVLLASSSLVCLSKVFFYNSLFEQSFFFTTVCLSKVEYHKRNAGKLALSLGGWPSRPTTSTSFWSACHGSLLYDGPRYHRARVFRCTGRWRLLLLVFIEGQSAAAATTTVRPPL
jgi:hypothetical protein